MTPKSAEQTTGTAIVGISVGAPALQKEKDHEEDEHDGFDNVFTTSFTETRTKGVVSYG
jgi:hypothetical protein